MTIGEETEQSVVFYPRDWWQSVKERFAPKWFLKRWPVEDERVVLTVKKFRGVCPHLGTDRDKCLKWMALQDDTL